MKTSIFQYLFTLKIRALLKLFLWACMKICVPVCAHMCIHTIGKQFSPYGMTQKQFHAKKTKQKCVFSFSQHCLGDHRGSEVGGGQALYPARILLNHLLSSRPQGAHFISLNLSLRIRTSRQPQSSYSLIAQLIVLCRKGRSRAKIIKAGGRIQVPQKSKGTSKCPS